MTLAGENRGNIPLISILIPTRNGADTLSELLAMLSIQTISVDEILIADSGSEDRTIDIAGRYGATILPIDPVTFDHGGTRTLLSRQAKGEILVFFTQDTIPKKRDSVEKLIAPLLSDPEIATSYGRQLPAFNADFFAKSLRGFNYSEHASVRSIGDKGKLGMKTAFTSNSFASYRRSALESIGFFQDGLIFGEDTIAVAHLLSRGKKIAYVPEAAVYHSHNYTPMEEFKRYFDIGVLHCDQAWFVKMFGSAEGQGKKYIQYVLRALYAEKKLHVLPELMLRIMLKYCGYRLGMYYRKLPIHLVPRLSLHQSWWTK